MSLIPDFGFPERKMLEILKQVWPSDKWDTTKIGDLYYWYKYAITEKGQKPFDPSAPGVAPMLGWLRDNTSYSDSDVLHWLAVFKRGIDEKWISPHYVNAGFAPKSPTKVVQEWSGDTLKTVTTVPSATQIGKTIKFVGIASIIAISLYFTWPLLVKLRKKG